jgi:hypothetical protein
MSPYTFPEHLGYNSLKSLVESLPHAYQTPHSRKHYTIEGFTDDFGSIVIPGKMNNDSFQSRHFYFKE